MLMVIGVSRRVRSLCDYLNLRRQLSSAHQPRITHRTRHVRPAAGTSVRIGLLR